MASGRRLSYLNPRLLRTIFLQLQQQQEAGLFCDVTLQGDGDGLHVHSCVIAACSPYLAKVLRCPSKMSTVVADFGGPDSYNRRIISLSGTSRCYLFPLVRYMYTSELEVAPADVHGVLKAAKKLQIPELESLNLEGGRLVRHDSGRKLNRGCFGNKKQTPIVHDTQHCTMEQENDDDHVHKENKPFSLESIKTESCRPDVVDNKCISQSLPESNQVTQAALLENDIGNQVTLKRKYNSPKQNGPVSIEQNKSSPGMFIDVCKTNEEKQEICSVSGNELVKRRKLNRGRKLNILANSEISPSHGAALDNSMIATSTTEEAGKQAGPFMVMDGSNGTVLSNIKCEVPHRHEKSRHTSNLTEQLTRQELCEAIPCKEEDEQLGMVFSKEINNREFSKDDYLNIEGTTESSVAHANLGGADEVHSDLKIKCSVEKDLISVAANNSEPHVLNKGSAEESEAVWRSSSEIPEVEKMKLRKLKNGQNWEVVTDEKQQTVTDGKLQIMSYSEREEHLTELEELLEQMFELPSSSSDVDVGGCSPTVWLGEGVWPEPSSESDEEIDVLH